MSELYLRHSSRVDMSGIVSILRDWLHWHHHFTNINGLSISYSLQMVNKCLHVVGKVSTVLDLGSKLNGLLFNLLLECFLLCSLHLSRFHDI